MAQLPADFFTKYWSKEPLLIKNLFHADEIEEISPSKFFEWCQPPASIRAFRLEEKKSAGTASAIVLENREWAETVFAMSAQQKDPITLLINKTEKVSPIIADLVSSMGIGRDWRFDDVVTTLSTKGSGIGFHAGHEDGFICQIHGTRRWTIHPPSVFESDYLQNILGDQTIKANSPERPQTPPILDIELNAGDALYLPPLYGHEGVTLADSISLSIAWKGLSPYFFLKKFSESPPLSDLNEMQRKQLFRLIPEHELSQQGLLNELSALFEDLLGHAIDTNELVAYLNLYREEVNFSMS